MPNFISDGSIISNSISLNLKRTHTQTNTERWGKYKARVEEVIFATDPRNTTKNTNNPQTEYTLTILGGSTTGQRIYGAKLQLAPTAGSPYNSEETVLSPNLEGDNNFDGNTAKQPEKTTGSIVVVEYLSGNVNYPIITGAFKHPKAPAATEEDGVSFKKTFNGVTFNITKDGAVSLSFGGGPQNLQGEHADENAAGASFSIGADGSLRLNSGDGQEIVLDKASKKIIIKSSEGIDTQTGSDYTLEVDGNVDITSGGTVNLEGSIVTIGGSGGLPSARLNDLVLGLDGEGRPINAWIGNGSSTVLVGG